MKVVWYCLPFVTVVYSSSFRGYPGINLRKWSQVFKKVSKCINGFTLRDRVPKSSICPFKNYPLFVLQLLDSRFMIIERPFSTRNMLGKAGWGWLYPPTPSFPFNVPSLRRHHQQCYIHSQRLCFVTVNSKSCLTIPMTPVFSNPFYPTYFWETTPFRVDFRIFRWRKRRPNGLDWTTRGRNRAFLHYGGIGKASYSYAAVGGALAPPGSRIGFYVCTFICTTDDVSDEAPPKVEVVVSSSRIESWEMVSRRTKG